VPVERGIFVGGREVATTGDRYEVFEPALGTVLGRVPEAGVRGVDEAVRAATEAFPAWRGIGAVERGERVAAFGRAVAARVDEFATLDARNAGNPIGGMRRGAQQGARTLGYFAGLSLQLGGSTIPASTDHLHYTVREPFGVVGVITPFNHPTLFATARIAAPLVAGNTVVLKPAHQTPLSALLLAEVAAESLPPGVLNVVTGGAATGSALVRHPGVRRIGFTGSVPTALAIQADAAASGTIKRLSFELGGKNPLIVLPDADLDRAAQAAVDGMNLTRVCGQSCGSTSRLFVHESMRGPLVERVAERMAKLRFGPPLEETTEIGPLVSQQQRDRVERYVAAGLDEGARLVLGGTRPAEAPFDRGWYFPPTIFDEVKPTMQIATDEIFGPVLSVIEWRDEAELLPAVNATRYGLAASIYTNRLDAAHRLAAQIEAGYIWINDVEKRWVGVPFGGYKDSGIGNEYSLEELQGYTQIKSVSVAL
jgi:acyl-CoA reductase-like NAD-dependent aldehyde dehydrogenase